MASAGRTCLPRWRRSVPRPWPMPARHGWCSGTPCRTPGRSGGCPPPPSLIVSLRAAGCWSASATCTASRCRRRRWPSLGWTPRPVGGGQTSYVTGADAPPASCGSMRAAPRWQWRSPRPNSTWAPSKSRRRCGPSWTVGSATATPTCTMPTCRPHSTSEWCGWLRVRRRACRGRSGRGPGSSLQARPGRVPCRPLRCG